MRYRKRWIRRFRRRDWRVTLGEHIWQKECFRRVVARQRMMDLVKGEADRRAYDLLIFWKMNVEHKK